MVQTSLRICGPELRWKPGELSFHRGAHFALQGTARAKGRKWKKSKLILFKEELSNNLCSPKMELAVEQQSWVAICQGGAAGPASWARKGWVREPRLILTAQGTWARGADLSPKKTNHWVEGRVNSVNLRLCLFSFWKLKGKSDNLFKGICR